MNRLVDDTTKDADAVLDRGGRDSMTRPSRLDLKMQTAPGCLRAARILLTFHAPVHSPAPAVKAPATGPAQPPSIRIGILTQASAAAPGEIAGFIGTKAGINSSSHSAAASPGLR